MEILFENREASLTRYALAERIGVDPVRAFRVARLLGIPVLTRDDEQVTSFLVSVTLCRLRDPDRIVTVSALAKERRVYASTIRQFFEHHPGLAERWDVVSAYAAIARRIALGVARFEHAHPGETRLRKRVTPYIHMKPKTVVAYLGNHPELAADLGIVYTYPGYGSGKSP
jgi:hypothetical protein